MAFKKKSLVRVINPNQDQQGKWYSVISHTGTKVTVTWVVSGSKTEIFDQSELTQDNSIRILK
jgi:hypothetical protein